MVQRGRLKAGVTTALAAITLISCGTSETDKSTTRETVSPAAEISLEKEAVFFLEGQVLPYWSTYIEGTDTIPEPVGSFVFRDWNNKRWTNDSLVGKPYVADFFFTSCPTICPGMTKAMKEVQEGLKNQQRDVQLISFTIDPKRDDSTRLKNYVAEYEIDTSNWSFLRSSNQEYVIRIAMEAFKQVAYTSDDPESGGFDHSSHLILVDKDGFMRGVYDAQEEGAIEELLQDVEKL